MGSSNLERRLCVETVCVIGAGPAGLAAAKYLLAEHAFSRITVFEQRSSVGGIWNYVPLPSGPPQVIQPSQLHPPAQGEEATRAENAAASPCGSNVPGDVEFLTPLYDRLETNIPRPLMGFSDLDWPDDCQLFPEHEKVLEYVDRYAEDVRHLIEFRTQVLDVRLTSEEKWIVTVQRVYRNRRGPVQKHVFDGVVVASGHFDVPFIPNVRGIREWSERYPGSISHSKFYRKPEAYADKKVVVVGNSASGVDIGTQIQEVCKLPILVSSKSESQFGAEPSPGKLDKPPIEEYIIADRSLRFIDGSVESDIDAVVYCTGYLYSFPFLNSLVPPVVTTGEWVENTYQHIFYQPQPSLAFLLLNQKVIPFPLAEAQSAIIARMFSGRLFLPSRDDMLAWEGNEVAEMGWKNLHVLKFPKDADYINMCYHWGMSANGSEPKISMTDGEVGNEGRPFGKVPPYWGEKEYWMREHGVEIKKAFQRFGEQRHGKRTLEDVGFSYEKWKDSKRG
ncbi:hypothetical protein M433DRAFT_154980 [Acidomyces richmondensis BFW]|nr:MAG: hypothetical protein FE78DRAFT_91502 [Acidomyces sp. 'richmondensis']KYG45022.1 hypothetical protein M433DRAFT_154980 [Acidomyces richmondensis BFW]